MLGAALLFDCAQSTVYGVVRQRLLQENGHHCQGSFPGLGEPALIPHRDSVALGDDALVDHPSLGRAAAYGCLGFDNWDMTDPNIALRNGASSAGGLADLIRRAE